MNLLIGLGNPGSKYLFTRHNAGFMAVDSIAYQENLSWNTKDKYQFAKWDKENAILLKPLTYMNLSGEGVLSFLSYYKVKPDKIIVFYDDKDIELGYFKLKIGGSSAGHNGIENLIQHIGNKFIRVRIGIGPKPQNVALWDFVLSNFSEEELSLLKPILDESKNIYFKIRDEGFSKAQAYYHRFFTKKREEISEKQKNSNPKDGNLE